MKHFIFTCVFLLFYGISISQNDIRMMGGAINVSYYTGNQNIGSIAFNSSTYNETDIGISYYYNSFHAIKNSSLYFTTGSKIFYNVNEKVLNASQRFGLGFNIETDGKQKVYANVGGELGIMGLGMYGSTHILFKGKKNYFVVSPEINVIHYNMYDFNKGTRDDFLVMVGCGIATGWNKKEFIAKEPKKYGVMNHFSVNIIGGASYSNQKIGENLTTYSQYLNINANYHLFTKQIISPEAVIGLLMAKGRTNYHELIEQGYISYGFYADYVDIVPYMGIGFNIQTRRKLAFIANAQMWTTINAKAIGSNSSIGIKYTMNNKIALSLSPTTTFYHGLVYGTYTSFEKPAANTDYIIREDIKVLHKSGSYNGLVGIKMGVHF